MVVNGVKKPRAKSVPICLTCLDQVRSLLSSVKCHAVFVCVSGIRGPGGRMCSDHQDVKKTLKAPLLQSETHCSHTTLQATQGMHMGILLFHHNLQINSLKILQCDFLDFFFLMLSVIVEVYLWWKLQASLIFLSGRTCTIRGWLNTFFCPTVHMEILLTLCYMVQFPLGRNIFHLSLSW